MLGSDYSKYGTPTYNALIALSRLFPKDEYAPFAKTKGRAYGGNKKWTNACDDIFLLAAEVLEEENADIVRRLSQGNS